jgi:hypothetical protein
MDPSKFNSPLWLIWDGAVHSKALGGGPAALDDVRGLIHESAA